MYNLLEWGGTICSLLGVVLIANKCIYGFHTCIFADFLLLPPMWHKKAYAVWWLCVAYIFINIIGIVQWSRS